MTRLLKILSWLVVASAMAIGVPVAANAMVPGPVAAAGATTVGSAAPSGVSSPNGSVRAAVPADTSDFTFALYAGEYYLGRDSAGHSTLRTVETFVAEFPDFDQNRGIIRAIPNDYDGVPLNTTVESVTDAQGEPVYFETEINGGFTELALGTDEFVRGSQTYVISYTQQNVVRAFADTNDDEFYWDTNGTGFDQPFGTVAARVHVDPAIASFLTGDNACYSGAQGESGDCQIVQETDPDAAAPDAAAPVGQMFTAEAVDLGPGENLTVAIGFTPGTFVQVPAEARSDADNSPGFGPSAGVGGFPFGLLGMAMLGGVFVLARAFARPRDPKGGTIIAQYSVPDGYNLLEAADLIGRPKSAMAAQIVSFAVRGNVRILDYPVSAGGGDYTLQLLRTDGVDDQELAVLATFFPGLPAGAVCELGVTNDPLARGLKVATADATVRNTARGWRARPPLTRVRIRLLVGLGALVALVVAVLVIGDPPAIWWSPLLLLAASAVIVGIVAGSRPLLLTAAGLDRRDYLAGMKVYLALAEADRFRMLQSPDGALRVTVPRTVTGMEPDAASTLDTVELVKLYEKLLPFAVLWGVEKEWATELEVYYEQATTTPDWFLSQNAFSGIHLSTALGGMVNSMNTTQTPTSSWSSSGGGSFSGGSGGGGFSGGGGGGGGGGGR
ncbi:hypothetical protein C3B59_03595 [Cryobacterium zongtaii]|uniref:DUF2207 domain-containing protein n=1 Tax=Cryobacterium zongtaii TaxID=1259217 RepID=A0A2S3ZNR1_9MICO|nr:DUF2207 domain-containing protein [Cryobacterium zongtaii]POH70766.1 hypothetical protein C3B59_03595 [Cryobacterium zongtaii]